MSPSEISENGSPKAIAIANQILDAVVMHPEFKRILTAAVAAVKLMLHIRMPTGLIVVADPGMGKSLLLNLIRRQLTTSDNPLVNERPVLHIELDSAVDTHKLAGKVLLSLGYPMLPSRPNLENMNMMIEKAMERLKPKALLIDESQHMCEGNRDLTARAMTDWLKIRMDKHNLPVLAFGTHTLDRILTINPQFASRASEEYAINSFEFGDTWMQLQSAFVEAVRLVDISVLLNRSVSRLVHEATRGNLRRFKKLLVHACLNAADRDKPVLKIEDLEHGHQKAFGVGPGRLNPFIRKAS